MSRVLIILIITSLIILVQRLLASQRRHSGIRGWITDQDLDGRGAGSYLNRELGISAKPDVLESKRIIEYKSADGSFKPRHGDMLQAAAEMLATGIGEVEIRYKNGRTFTFTKDSPELKAAMEEVRRTVEKMRAHLIKNHPPRGAPTKKKCSGCHFNGRCDDCAA